DARRVNAMRLADLFPTGQGEMGSEIGVRAMRQTQVGSGRVLFDHRNRQHLGPAAFEFTRKAEKIFVVVFEGQDRLCEAHSILKWNEQSLSWPSKTTTNIFSR